MIARLCLRRYRSTNGLGIALFRQDQNPWRTYLVLSLRPRQHRFLLRLPHYLVGLSWWPPRLLGDAVLRTETRSKTEQKMTGASGAKSRAASSSQTRYPSR